MLKNNIMSIDSKGFAANDQSLVSEDAEISETQRKWDAAMKKWNEVGHLGVTADDHWAIGGSPDLELNRNNGKTLGELWDMPKIKEFLDSNVAMLENGRTEYAKDSFGPDSHWFRDDITSAKKSLRLALSYLKSIDKLPSEYSDYEINDEEYDPK
jgi:hypothetical protein